MKKFYLFTVCSLLFASCERYYDGGHYPEEQTQEEEQVQEEELPFKIQEFEVDQCTYFAVYSYGSTTTAVEVEHKANCPNH